MDNKIKQRLRSHVRWIMEATGVPPTARPHLQDRLLRGGLARVNALRRGGLLWMGTEVYWPRAGVADVGLLELSSPGPHEVLVRTDLTAVSPGTERALLNLMPGTTPKFPLRPGYTGSGTIVRVGSRVARLKVGDRVACTETMHHASLALVREGRAFPLSERISSEDGALLQLIIIALQGVMRGASPDAGRVVIIGAGLIGQLALQLARVRGAGFTAMVASSSAKRRLSLASGANLFVDAHQDARVIDELQADTVIEVTGSPDGLELAVRAAAPQARVVLLGSTRGVNRQLDFDALIRRRELSLVGSHISGLGDDAAEEQRSYRSVAEAALRLLAAGRLTVAPLLTDVLSPLDAPVFYRRLCRGDRGIVGALFDWRRLEDAQRCRRSVALAPPRDLLRVGRAYDQIEGAPSLIVRSPSWLTQDLDVRPTGDGVVRFGLIGCGGMGVRHAAAIRSAPNARLVATMDLDERLARELAGDAFYASRLEDLLAREDVDAVVIVTPNHLHESIGVQAARAGKHVIVEKPIAHNLESADRLVRACRDAGVELSVGYSFRYAPEVRLARRLVEHGLLGKLLSVQLSCYFDKPPSYYGSGYTNRTHSDWRAVRDKAGGGVLVMNMSHQLDQIRYIIGQDIGRVTGVTGVLDSPERVEVEDVVSVACEFEDGAVGSLFGTCFARGLSSQIELRILGDAGSIVLEPPFRFMTLRGAPGVTPGRWHRFGDLPTVDVHAAYISWFAEAVLKHRTPEISGDDGRAIQAWMDAIYTSARLRRPASVAPTLAGVPTETAVSS